MNWKDPQLDERLKHFIDALRPIPARNRDVAAHAKANFLKQAAELRAAAAGNPGLKADRLRKPFFQFIGLSQARNFLVASLTALIILFAGTGATVYAAQGSLPGDNLYPLKTLSEDAILVLTPSPQARLNLVLGFSDRRVFELSRLQALGRLIPADVTERLNNESDQALSLAAAMDDQARSEALGQIIKTADSQSKIISDLLAHSPQNRELEKAFVRSQQQAHMLTTDQGPLSNIQQKLLPDSQTTIPRAGQPEAGTHGNPNADSTPGLTNSNSTPGPNGEAGKSQGSSQSNSGNPPGLDQGSHPANGPDGTSPSQPFLPGVESPTPTPTPTPKPHGPGVHPKIQVH